MDRIYNACYTLALGGGFAFSIVIICTAIAMLFGRVKFFTFREPLESEDAPKRDDDYYGGDSW